MCHQDSGSTGLASNLYESPVNCHCECDHSGFMDNCLFGSGCYFE